MAGGAAVAVATRPPELLVPSRLGTADGLASALGSAYAPMAGLELLGSADATVGTRGVLCSSPAPD